jgi:outer membrane receptor for ferrienterochelin and colicin
MHTYRKLRFLFPFAIFIISFLLAGESGKISGRVLDSQGNVPLPGANVRITALWSGGKETPVTRSLGAAADPDGRFFILNIPPGTYSLEASFLGYKNSRTEKIEVSVDRTTTADFQLISEAIPMEAVVATAERQGIVKDRTSSAVHVSSEEIQVLPVETFTDVVTLQAGVTVDAGGGLHIRGGRTSEIQYYVDGIALSNPFSNSLAVPVENNAIQQLQVISGTFNAEYGEALSGIINIVTKEGGEQYSGGLSVYGGDYVTNNPVFFHLQKHELRQQYLEGNVSGPVPVIPNVSFFVSGRLSDEQNQFYGERLYNIRDSSAINSADTSEWYVEKSGDRTVVAMSPFINRSWQSKITFMPDALLKISYAFSGNSSEGKGYNHQFKYNPDFLPTTFSTSSNHSLKLNHTLDPSTFYLLTLSYYHDESKSYVFADPFDPRYAAAYGRGVTPSDVFSTGGVSSGRSERKSDTWAARLDLSSQVTNAHLMKGGVEARFNDMFIESYGLIVDPNRYGDYLPRIPPLTSVDHDRYRKFPYQLAGYVQDKIEIDDLIINVGFRYDYFDAQSLVPTNFSDPGNVLYPRPSSLAYTKAKPKSQISPRFGFAFPITESGVIHASYGQFFQIPPMSSLYVNPDFKMVSGLFNSFIGNADLEPQRSVMYELGLQQQIFEQVNIDVTAFYRDVRHLLGSKLYETYVSGQRYGRYYNVDYGSVKGVTLSVSMRPSAASLVSANVDYTYSVAEGNGSDPLQAFNDARGNDESTKMLVPLAWDIRHNIASTMTVSDRIWGASIVATYKTGFPFTPGSFVELRNSDRGLDSYNINVNLFRNFILGDLRCQLFLKVENLTDTYTNDSVPKIDPRDEQNHAANNLQLLNTLYEYRNNPAAYPAPRLVKAGVRLEY